jgi:hypothetical protein
MITLTLTFDTVEQAHHVLEAFNEARGFVEQSPAPVQQQQSPAPVQQQSVELDTRGVPYHPQFHAETRKRNADGSWARRRNHDRAAADAYEAPFLATQRVAAEVVAATSLPPAMGPSIPDFHALWTQLCAQNRVTMADQDYIIATWGGHPMSPIFADDAKRAAAHAYLMQRMQ